MTVRTRLALVVTAVTAVATALVGWVFVRQLDRTFARSTADQLRAESAALVAGQPGGELLSQVVTPEGKVLPIETTFTPEQARIIERLAWDVIKNYPDCGLYEDGTQPCGKPEFSNDGKIITLKSSTPGAWFRYTLDGTAPTRTRGYVYCGAISVQPGIQVKVIAYKSGMADSEIAEAR